MQHSDSRPLKKAGLEEKAVADELLLYDPEQERAVSLNSSATMIWSLCDGTRTTDDIAGSLASGLGVTPEDLLEDVRTAIWDMFLNGLIDFE